MVNTTVYVGFGSISGFWQPLGILEFKFNVLGSLLLIQNMQSQKGIRKVILFREMLLYEILVT